MNKQKTVSLLIGVIATTLLTGCFDNNNNDVKSEVKQEVQSQQVEAEVKPALTENKEENPTENKVVVQDSDSKSVTTIDNDNENISENKQAITPEALPSDFFAPLVESKDYIKLSVDPEKNFVESSYNKPVIFDFFWYGCGHCNEMRPYMKAILESHSNFKSVKAAAAFPNWDSGTKLFLTYQNMNLLDQLHELTFDALHVNKKNILGNKEQLDAFLTSNKVDVTKFYEFQNGFQMSRDLQRAKDITAQYKLQSTPNMGIYYKGFAYMVNPSISNGYQGTAKSLNLMLDKFTTEQIKGK